VPVCFALAIILFVPRFLDDWNVGDSSGHVIGTGRFTAIRL
jgi:hypothetical protein